MKPSELLQYAIDNHLAADDTITHKHTPFLCNAVKRARTSGEVPVPSESERVVLDAIDASIDDCEQYKDFLGKQLKAQGADACCVYGGTAAQDRFIQFLRKKRAEHIIAMLQARGE